MSRTLRVLAVLAAVAAATTAAAPGVIRVHSGDTLWELARTHRTSVAVLRHLNHLEGSTIYAGQLLRVPSAAPASSRVTVERRVLVRRGDTLIGLARRHRTTPQAIARRNHLPASLVVRLGETLVVPVRVPAHAGTAKPAAQAPAGSRYRSSTLRSAARHRATLRDRKQPSRAYVRKLIRKAAREVGVDPALALAVAYQESGFQMRVVSPADAIGVMQVLPSTGRWLSRDVVGRDLDLLRVEDNVVAGVVLLDLLLRVAPTPTAVAGYYQGLASVRSRGLLPETKQYVANVLRLRAARFA